MKKVYSEEYKQLGLNISYYRKKASLSQEKLAEKLILVEHICHALKIVIVQYR